MKDLVLKIFFSCYWDEPLRKSPSISDVTDQNKNLSLLIFSVDIHSRLVHDAYLDFWFVTVFQMLIPLETYEGSKVVLS